MGKLIKICFVFLFLFSFFYLDKEEGIEVTFLDIGQGDATFIQFSNGQQMLVDCSKDARVISALGRVMPFYDHHIDYLLITHPDLDHYGGCEEVLRRFDVDTVVYNGLRKEESDTWNSFFQAIEDEGGVYYEISREESWEFDGTFIRFLYPDRPVTKNDESNNTSIVFQIEYEGVSLLMMGDAEAELEEYLLGKYGDELDVDVLKLGHHGSNSSSIQDFVDITSPDYAIVSAGEGNRFGHPSLRVLKRLERAGAKVLRTDLMDDIIVEINNNGLFYDN